MKKSCILFCFLSWSILCFEAQAHRPIFSEKTATSPETAVIIAEPDVSQVIYREITEKTPQVWLAFDANEGSDLFIQIGIPVLDRLKNFRPAMMVIGPGLPKEDFQVEIPNGMGGRDFSTDNVKEPRFFHEHFTGTDSWILRSDTIILPNSGRYYLVAYVPSNEYGKLWLSIGKKEVFGAADLVKFGEWKKRIRRFHEVEEMSSGVDIPILSDLSGLLKSADQSASSRKIVDPCEETSTEQSSKYLKAVCTFADNVLKYGRDTYGPKHTPLFVDGLNIHTHEPAKWIAPNGDRWILSNLASQQNLFRTLDSLTKITGDPKYKQAAKESIEYAFSNLQSPNGLFYWGNNTAYDAQEDKPVGPKNYGHVLKANLPYYELMWQVSPEATKAFIESFWSAHVIDWSNLNMNRIGWFDEELEKAWNHEYEEGPIFLEPSGSNKSFINAGIDLAYAAAMLTKLSGDKESLVWANRIVHRYVRTRHPKTGISFYMYTKPEVEMGEYYDDVMSKLVPGMTDFPIIDYFPWNLNPVDRKRNSGQSMPSPGISVYNHVFYWQSLFLIGTMLDGEGNEFKQWALEELTAFGKASYRKKDNTYVPILTDGTNLEGYAVKEDGILGSKSILKSVPVGLSDFWAYAMGYRIMKNKFMWQIARSISLGNGLGDIGKTSEDLPQLRLHTNSANPYALLGFMELYEVTGKSKFLEIAKRIGDNILVNRFHKGFFVASNKHIYTKFDAIDSLVLLHLYSALVRETTVIPQVWPSVPCFICPYRNQELATDNALYTLVQSTELPLSLHEAASIGDVNMVNSLLEEGIGVDSWGEVGKKTALQCAAMSGKNEVVELLLTKGASIDAQADFPCGTALDYAAENGHRDLVELLIAHGANINARRGYPAGDRPLHSAVRAGHKDIVELLIAKGADVNAKNDNGQTPLDIVRNQNRRDMIELFLAKGITISSLHAAAQIGDLTSVKTLLKKGADVNAQDDEKLTPLHYAVREGHKELAEFLIANDGDVNSKDKHGYTPLYYAIGSGNKDIVNLLIAKGSEVNLKPEKDYTPLHYAVWMADLDVVKLLVEKGAEFNIKALDGWTAFRYAVHQGSKEMVEFFISKDADMSGFHIAAFMGDISGMKESIERGSKVDEKDEAGWTALFWAACAGQTEVAEFLIDKGADISATDGRGRNTLHQATQANAIKLVELLISKGVSVNTKDKRGNTPLYIACQRGNIDVVELLIDKGVDINAKARSDQTALHSAAMMGRRDMTALLIAKGADVNCKDINGQTPLHLSVRQGHRDIVELLINDGADINATNKWDRTPLDIAFDRDHNEIIQLLQEHVRESGKGTNPSASSADTEQQPIADMIFSGEAEGDAFGDYTDFGKDVNGDGHNDIIVGSPRYDYLRGRAWLFYGGPNIDDKPDIILEGKKVGDGFGVGVLLGDINGDSNADVIVGEALSNSHRGKVYVFYGGVDIDKNADKIFEGKYPNSWFGRWQTLDDINGDRIPDLMITAVRWDNERGRVYIFHGSADGDMDTTYDLILDGENRGDYFGRQTAAGKDVNGDGYPDLIVGAEYWPNNDKNRRGRAYLYYGGPNMDTEPDMIFTGELSNPGSRFGNAVELCDVDNDGFADVIIGDPFFRGSQGRTYLYFGGDGMDNIADRVFRAGADIACGDMNKDGYTDIILGGTLYSNRISAVHIYHGGPARLIDQIPDKILKSQMPQSRFGVNVKVADLNSNGFDDLLVGAWGYNSNQGRVYLFYGGPKK